MRCGGWWRRSRDPRVGYVCGEVQLVDARGSNQEGLYWRYELALRALESRVRSVTGGNGAIYATRREAYLVVDPIMGHDLSFPFNMVKRGWLALAVREAQASEKMVPTIEGEFARKRRMMSHTWPIVLRGGMLSPARLRPAVRADDRLAPDPPLPDAVSARDRADRQHRAARRGMGVRGHARAPARRSCWRPRSRGFVPAKPMLLARYYVLTTASLAAGLWDWLVHGTSAGWEPAEGTR